LRNHSFQAAFNYQHNSGRYNASVLTPRVSGYHQMNRPASELRNSVLLNYRFPTFYPDWELRPLAYIKSIKGGLYTDVEGVGHPNKSAGSSGFELRADMNLLRFYLPEFDLGFKYIRPHRNPGGSIIEFSLSYMY